MSRHLRQQRAPSSAKADTMWIPCNTAGPRDDVRPCDYDYRLCISVGLLRKARSAVRNEFVSASYAACDGGWNGFALVHYAAVL